MLTLSGLLSVLTIVIVAGLIFWLLWWLLQRIALPEPFAKVGQALLALVAVFFLIALLLQLAGHPIIAWR